MRKLLLSMPAAVGFAVAVAAFGNRARSGDLLLRRSRSRDRRLGEVRRGSRVPARSATRRRRRRPRRLRLPHHDHASDSTTAPPPTTTSPPPPPPPPPPSPSIDPNALPPNVVAELDEAGAGGFTTASIVEKCRFAYAGVRFRNRITGNVYWTTGSPHTFCWMGNMITRVYGQTAQSIQADYPWFFSGNLAGPTTSGGLTSRRSRRGGTRRAWASTSAASGQSLRGCV